MWFAWFLGCIIQALIFGFITKHVAESKGYDTGFAWGFWLGLIGLIVVAVKPNVERTPYRPMYPDAQQTQKRTWLCICGQSNSETLQYCTRCRRSRQEAKAEEKKACPHCGAMNRKSNITCFACGKPMNASAPAQVIASAAVISSEPVQAAPAQTTNGMKETAQVDECLKLLDQLGQLHEKGILTDEEFQKKKQELLDRI